MCQKLNVTTEKVLKNSFLLCFMLVISLSALAQVKLETEIKITDEVIYENHDIDNAIDIQNDGRFNTGVYLVKITDSVQKEYFKKIVIE